MGTKTFTRKTADERRAEAAALHEGIIARIETLRDSDEWTKFLNFTQGFHAYSLNNIMLILGQNPDASAVAGFNQWRERGRQVRKGEKSIKIFGFSEKKLEEIGPDGEPLKQKIFPILSVFDISQTDPIDGEEVDDLAPVLTGEDPHGIADAAAKYITSRGFTVSAAELPGEIRGITSHDEKTVKYADNLAPAQKAKTLLHEAAHTILHTDLDEYHAHRGIAETEAESVAYIVAGILGLDTSSYSIGYIAGWSDCDTAMIRDTAARVLKTAHTIADALTTTQCPTPEVE